MGEPDPASELDALNALEKEAKEYDKDAEIDRILKSFRLDSYAVLDLQPGIPDSTIKLTYRKKSLLIHPDKTKNPSAPEAFDRLAKAQSALLDETARTHLDNCIADARTLLIRAKKMTTDSEEVKNPDPEFMAEWRRKTVEVLVDAEARRRRQAQGKMREEGREKRREEEEIEERKRKRDAQEEWEKTREGRIGSWRDWQKGMKRKEPDGAGKVLGGDVNGGVKGTTGEKKKKKMKVLG
ncbi:MAG: hypothetical protein Q9227_006781 [Pyrenula ochraceoflavens]